MKAATGEVQRKSKHRNAQIPSSFVKNLLMGTDSRLVPNVTPPGFRALMDQRFSLRVKTCPVNNLKLEEKQPKRDIRNISGRNSTKYSS